MPLLFRQREFCLIIFLFLSLFPLRNCASDDEGINLRLTLAPPGHQLTKESNIQLNDAQNKDQIIIDKSIQGAKHTKRKRRTKAEMQGVDRNESTKQQYREAEKRYTINVYKDPKLLEKFRAGKRRIAANRLLKIKKDPKELAEYRAMRKRSREALKIKRNQNTEGETQHG